MKYTAALPLLWAAALLSIRAELFIGVATKAPLPENDVFSEVEWAEAGAYNRLISTELEMRRKHIPLDPAFESFPYYLRTNYLVELSIPLEGEGAFETSIGVFVDPAGSMPLLRPIGGFGGTLADGGNSYAVERGALIDAGFVTNTDPFYSNADVHNYSGDIALTKDEPFYMAFWLRIDSDPVATNGSVNIYGWMEFQYSEEGLHLLDSAAQNDGTSIAAGIPEPSALLLLVCGGGGIALLRRFFH